MNNFKRILAVLLCLLMVVAVMPDIFAGEEIPDVPECDKGCGEGVIYSHNNDCAVKVFYRNLYDEKTAAELYELWDSLHEDVQNFYLNDYSWNSKISSREKRAELVSYLDGTATPPTGGDEEDPEIPDVPVDIEGENIEISGKIPAGSKVVMGETSEKVAEMLKEKLPPCEDHHYTIEFFNIKIHDKNNKEWQPKEAVTVTLTLEAFLGDNTNVEIFHILDNEDAIKKAEDNERTVESFKDDDGNDVYYTIMSSDNGEVTIIDEHTVSFETDSFSDYAARAGGYALDASAYKSDREVFWDVAESKGSSYGQYTGSATRIKSVYFNGNPTTGKVVKGNSGGKPSVTDKRYDWRASGVSDYAESVGTYYSSNTTRELTIVPGDGYYVKRVIIACTAKELIPGYGPSTVISDPYGCGTWLAGNQYDQILNFEYTGAVTIDVPRLAFCHLSNNSPSFTNAYFILIEVGALPSPLYVEYNYGDIVKNLTSATNKNAFTGSSKWLAEYKDASGNVLNGGNYDPDTQFTQFRYKTSGDDIDKQAQQAAQWKHYANVITPAAIAAAEAEGYLFKGWYAEYYTTCNASTPGSNNNNYTYTFGGERISTADYQPGDQVPLSRHVKLTAKWEKAETYTLTVNKVTVNDTDTNAEFTFNVEIGNKKESFTLKNGESKTYTAIKGTSYKVEEVTNSNYTTKVDGAQSGTLNSNVTVTYTNTRKVADVTVEKKIVKEGNPDHVGSNFTFSAKLWADGNKNRQIPFPETIGTGITRSSDGLTATFTLETNGSKVTFKNLPVGAVLEVTETNVENADETTNDCSPSNNGKTATYAIESTTAKTITFTNTYVQKVGSVKVVKNLVDNAYNKDLIRKFEFTATMKDGSAFTDGSKEITFSLGDGESKQIDNIPINSTVVITETAVDGYTTTNTAGNGSVAEVTVTQTLHTVTFTNTRITKSLTITKNVVNTGEELELIKDRVYPMVLEIDGSVYAGPAKKNGSAETVAGGNLSLKNGDTYVIENIAVNSKYSVTENIQSVTAPDGFEYKAPMYAVGEGAATAAPVVDASLTDNATVTVTNEIKGIYGYLVISKTGIDELDHKAGDEFQNTIYRIQSLDANGDVDDRLDMQVTITYNGSVQINKIPVGKYKVTEITDWSWRYEPEEDVVDVTVTGGKTAEAPFENVRTNKYWLSGDWYARNWWGEAAE
ncbi:MAG: hypothetical protein E7218_03430 [Anaerofustis stercorihominis]|nr:hypothetical protein [Anaerofustis stercorihominis]